MAFSKDLTKPVKEAFTEDGDTKVVELTENDVGQMWHSSRADNGFSEDASEVKGFFDYISRRVLFPWMQGAVRVINKLSDRLNDLAGKTIKSISMRDHKLFFIHADGSEFISDSLKGDKGDPGPKGDTGNTGATGPTGPAGKTPERGVDYWTEKDKNDIKSYVENAILGGEW